MIELSPGSYHIIRIHPGHIETSDEEYLLPDNLIPWALDAIMFGIDRDVRVEFCFSDGRWCADFL